MIYSINSIFTDNLSPAATREIHANLKSLRLHHIQAYKPTGHSLMLYCFIFRCKL